MWGIGPAFVGTEDLNEVVTVCEDNDMSVRASNPAVYVVDGVYEGPQRNQGGASSPFRMEVDRDLLAAGERIVGEGDPA